MSVGNKQSHPRAEILSALRSVAARKNNLARRQKHGTMRKGDERRLLILSRALKLLQAALKLAKQVESGRVAR